MAGKKDPRIEGNIWRDRMQYGFELHSCRLGFSFANDRLPREHGWVAIRVLLLPLLNFRGCIFSAISPCRIISGLLLRFPVAFFPHTWVTPGFLSAYISCASPSV